MKRYRKIEIIKAYDASKDNLDSMDTATMCGCYNCLQIFETSKIKTCIDGDAICPHCGEASLIPDNAGFKLEDEFLKMVNKYWI
jgi:hypothetical protein